MVVRIREITLVAGDNQGAIEYNPNRVKMILSTDAVQGVIIGYVILYQGTLADQKQFILWGGRNNAGASTAPQYLYLEGEMATMGFHAVAIIAGDHIYIIEEIVRPPGGVVQPSEAPDMNNSPRVPKKPWWLKLW